MLAAKNPEDVIISQYPTPVTAKKLREWIGKNDEESKQRMADLIYHRLNHRYIQPLQHILPEKFKSGFLMMASACLMIETLQSFYAGKKETPAGQGSKWFKDFFERERKLFPEFAEKFMQGNDNFYTNIRCGILHQAETKRGYRILRIGPLLDQKAKTINAVAFLEALERCLDDYVFQLRVARLDSELWKNAIQKLKFICENCEQ